MESETIRGEFREFASEGGGETRPRPALTGKESGPQWGIESGWHRGKSVPTGPIFI